MKEKKFPSVVSFYTVAAISLVWAIALPLYKLPHFICFGLVNAIVFLITWQIWPQILKVPDKKLLEEERRKAEAQLTGDEVIDRMIKDRDAAFSEMKRLNKNITDEKISDQIDHLEEVTGKIVDYVVEHPNKKKQVRRFFNYYLPTTIKLLDAYDRMADAGISGMNIDGTKGKIEDMMSTAVAAYDKQLDALYADEALDISTDITVMDNLMESEGLKQ